MGEKISVVQRREADAAEITRPRGSHTTAAHSADPKHHKSISGLQSQRFTRV